MAYLNYLKQQKTERITTDVFYGLNRGLRIADGEWNREENLSSREFPLLAPRPLRGVVSTLTEPQGVLMKDSLAIIDNGRFYYNGAEQDISLDGSYSGRRQMVSMGAYICVFPDKVYFNTADFTDKGSMEARYSSSGSVRYTPCTLTGDGITADYVGAEAPSDPLNGEYWINTSGSVHGLYVYSAGLGVWQAVAVSYVKITFASQGSIPRLFSLYDGITITGCAVPSGGGVLRAEMESLCGSKIIYGIGGEENGESDYIIVSGFLDNAVTQSSGTVSLSREVPETDYVIEAGNRLWGCRFGNNGSENVNGIYASALGDFRNWSRYMGVSTDSYAVSVGSDGPFTGAVNYLGSPCFFKENCLHRVTVSAVGAHSVAETRLRGPARGCGESLCIVDEVLYYLGAGGVCGWQGAFPEEISGALGDGRYFNAAAGTLNGKYYLSAQGEDGEWEMLCYDARRGIWHREDGTHALMFAPAERDLYFVSALPGGGYALNTALGTEGTKETAISWTAESGVMYYEYPGSKYLSRFVIRARLPEGAALDIYLQYDSSGDWVHSGHISLSGLGSAAVPIRPRRCDHLKLRLTAEGEVKVFSISRILERGSDM